MNVMDVLAMILVSLGLLSLFCVDAKCSSKLPFGKESVSTLERVLCLPQLQSRGRFFAFSESEPAKNR